MAENNRSVLHPRKSSFIITRRCLKAEVVCAEDKRSVQNEVFHVSFCCFGPMRLTKW